MKFWVHLWNEIKDGMAMLGAIAFLINLMELLGFENDNPDIHFRAKFIVFFFVGFMVVRILYLCFSKKNT